MGILSWLTGPTDGQGTPVYECRGCGTSLDGIGTDCPYCGPTDVVQFDLGR